MPEYSYQKYSERSDEDLANRAAAKDKELEFIFSKIKIPKLDKPRIIVLGCPDKRMVPAYEALFEKYFGARADLTVIDIEIEHLKGAVNVIEHDATIPFPNPPYNLVYSHVLLKFIETEKQWNVLENSYKALTPGGLAIHIFDSEDIEEKNKLQLDGWFSVPLDRWKDKLKNAGIKYELLSYSFEGQILGINPNAVRGLKGVALVLVK